MPKTTRKPRVVKEAKTISPYQSVTLNKEMLIQVLDEILSLSNVTSLRERVQSLKLIILSPKNDRAGLVNIGANGDAIIFRKDIFVSEIDQILEANTLERAIYYLQRIRNGIEKIKTGKINDINLLRWKEYDNVITDSLWVMERRDTSGAHWGGYWGNFIPQIPHQMIIRYTKKQDWVLDTFVGSGTTLIECRRLGRNGIGIELNPDVAQKARELVVKEPKKGDIVADVVNADSRAVDLHQVLTKYRQSQVQLLIMHPPYHDIIKFSGNQNDLSTAGSTEQFLKMFGEVVDNATPYLENGRYFALVIGDKYSKGDWIPLGFYCMQEVLKRNYTLKSIIVKNFEETRGKRNQKELWRYRALVGGFYVFKHEYIMLFKKKG